METPMNPSLLSTNKPLAGQYVVVQGNQTTSGVSAADVAALLESKDAVDIKIFKIRYVHPDGRIEMAGVPNERFQLEDGFLFFHRDLHAARTDFLTLCRLADQSPPPCRAKVQLANLSGALAPHVVALVFPAEYSDEVAAWLASIAFEGGELVESGVSRVTDYYDAQKTISFRQQLWGTQDGSLAAEQTSRRAAGA